MGHFLLNEKVILFVPSLARDKIPQAIRTTFITLANDSWVSTLKIRLRGERIGYSPNSVSSTLTLWGEAKNWGDENEMRWNRLSKWHNSSRKYRLDNICVYITSDIDFSYATRSNIGSRKYFVHNNNLWWFGFCILFSLRSWNRVASDNMQNRPVVKELTQQ